MADEKKPETPENMQATAEAAKETNNQFDKLSSTLNTIVDRLEKILKLEDEISLTAKTNIFQLEAEVEALKKIEKFGETDLERLQSSLEIGRKKEEIAKNDLILKTKELEDAKKILENAKENGKNIQEAEKNYNKTLKDLEETKKQLSDLITLNNENERSSEEQLKIAEKKYNVTLQEKFLVRDIGIAFQQQLGTTLGISSLVENLYLGMNPFLAITKEIVLENIKLIDVVMKGNQLFAATTGQIAQRSLLFGYGMSQFGIGFEQMNESMMGLFISMSGFTDQTQEIQEQLAAASAKMKNLGVDANAMGKNFDILTKSLKMSSETAIETQDKIAKAAIGAGIAPSVMLKEFANNMPRLAAYGQQAVDIFIKLEKQAKSLGMSVQELNSIVGEQYDTFDGAATGAGKLNAILGGNYLNSIQMMNANESERILIIKRAIDASGLQVEGMHKFQKIAIANAMGIKDLNQLNNLLGKSTTQLTMDMEKEAASQKELEKVQREAAETQKQLAAVFQSLLIIIKPLVDIIKGFVNVIAQFMDYGNGLVGMITTLTLLFTYFGIKIFGVGNSFKFASFFTKLFGTTAAQTTVESARLPDVINRTGGAGAAASPGIITMSVSVMQLGAAIALVGIGIGTAAAGIGYLVNSFKGLGNSTTTAAIGVTLFALAFAGMVIGLKLLLPVIAAVGTGVLYFAGGVALLGLGVGLAAVGFGHLVESIGKLSSVLTADVATNLMNISKAIAALVVVLTGTGAMGLLGLTVGSIALATSLSTIISSVNKIEEGKMTNFSSMLKTLAETLKLSGIETISVQIANAINNISAAIDKVPESKAVNFTTTMDSINRTFASVAQTDATKLESAKQFVDTATRYYTVQKDSKGADNDALVSALAKAIGGMSVGKGVTGGPENIVIKLEVDGKPLADVVYDYIKKKPAVGSTST